MPRSVQLHRTASRLHEGSIVVMRGGFFYMGIRPAGSKGHEKFDEGLVFYIRIHIDQA